MLFAKFHQIVTNAPSSLPINTGIFMNHLQKLRYDFQFANVNMKKKDHFLIFRELYTPSMTQDLGFQMVQSTQLVFHFRISLNPFQKD